MAASRGFGLAGETPHETIIAAAVAAEQAGYHTFWLSQPRHGNTLATLAAVAQQTTAIRLGVGAIPFTRQDADAIHRTILELALPVERLRLGVGSGTGRGAMDRLRKGVERLRHLIDVEIVVAPLGPKMCELAGQLADTVLFTWLTADYAARSAAQVREGAAAVDHQPPSVAAYVRCAVGEQSRQRLQTDSQRYGSLPHYAAHFARQGVEPIETTVIARDVAKLQDRLAEYERVLDHVVVRAATANADPDDVLALVKAGKPR